MKPNDSANYATTLTLMKDTSAGVFACPVVVQVNNTDAKQHWVVVTKFSGDDASPSADSFTCVDPWTGTEKPLKSAENFQNIYKTRAFYK
jgi:hypothetical protein